MMNSNPFKFKKLPRVWKIWYSLWSIFFITQIIRGEEGLVSFVYFLYISLPLKIVRTTFVWLI